MKEPRNFCSRCIPSDHVGTGAIPMELLLKHDFLSTVILSHLEDITAYKMVMDKVASGHLADQD